VAAAGVTIGALALDIGGDSQAGLPAANGSTGDGSDGTGASATLVIDDFAFSAVTVAPGARVTVENRDSVPHTATARNRAFDTGDLDSGGVADFVAPATPGSHPIGCAIHPDMTGTVVVAAGGGDVTGPAAAENPGAGTDGGPESTDHDSGTGTGGY
jgi:plastocyanin